MRIPIVFSTDHNFVMPTCVTILSLLRSASSSTEFDINIIVSPDVNLSDKEIIGNQIERERKNCNVNFIDIGEVFSKGYETRGISNACYSRLLIPWLITKYDKIIYSDVDVIFKGDISEAYETDLEDSLVAGVSGDVWNKGRVKKYLQKIGADPREYVNSGFLVINSKKQREDKLDNKYFELIKQKFVYQDQDIINIACKGKIKSLPPYFNVKPSLVYKEFSGNVKMIHYIGLKPWQYFTYCWDEWWKIYKESIVFKADFYTSSCKKILNLRQRLLVLVKQIRENLRLKMKLILS